MNLGEIRRRVYQFIGDDPANPHYMTPATINRYINDTYVEWCENTGCLEDIDVLNITSGTATYTLREDMGPVFRVGYDGWRIERRTMAELDREMDQWENHTGTPSDYILSDQNDGIRLYPNPSASGGDSLSATTGIIRTSSDASDSFSSTTGIIRTSSDDSDLFPSSTGIVRKVESQDDTLEVWAKITPTELSADSDSPDLPGFLHLGIVFGATERVLRMESEVKNEVLADFYALLAGDYEQFTARLVGRREPARTVVKGEYRQKPRAKRFPRYPFNYEIPQP